MHCTPLASFLTVALFRHMEDFVTWVDTSKIKRTIMSYNDEVDPHSMQSECAC